MQALSIGGGCSVCRRWARYAALKRQFGDVSKLQSEVQTLTTKLDTLEDQIRFKGLPAGGRSVTALKARIGAYRVYLGTLGYVPSSSAFDFVVDPKADMNAYFDGARLVIAPPLVGAIDTILRDYSFRALKELKPDFWDANLTTASGLASGIADYLPASYLASPVVGREFVRIYRARLPKDQYPKDYLRNLANSSRFPQPGAENFDQYGLGEAWGGMFWTLRTAIGCPATKSGCPIIDQMILDSWRVVPLNANFGRQYARILIAKTRLAAGAAASDQLRRDLVKRGMVL